MPVRWVMDTAAVVAAVRSNAGASNRLLIAALERRWTVLLSTTLLIEYEAVLTRPEHIEASGLSASEIGAVLDALTAVAEPVRLAYLWRPATRDPNDDMVLETAVNGGADAIVTFNIRDFAAAERFGIAVISPADAVRSLGALS